MRTIKIFDTTLRDGEQSPGCSMSVKEKVMVAKKLDELNVDVMEAGFAASSKSDFEAIKEISKIVNNASVASLARLNKRDIDMAWEAIKDAKKPRIHVFIGTSDTHVYDKLGKTKDEVLKMVKEWVSYAKEKCYDIEFSLEDATRTDRVYACKVIDEAIKAGATTINIPDTVGYTSPDEFRAFISYLKENSNLNKVNISVHCHNDLGLATANSMSAILAGVTQVECTINGIGERAGNTALEEVVANLDTKKEYYNAKTNINTKMIYEASLLVSSITGSYVQHNKPIVGANAFKHEAGIHQAGVLKNKKTYEIMDPKRYGIYVDSMVIGVHSGKHVIIDKMKKLGFDSDNYDVERITFDIKEFFKTSKTIEDSDIISIINNNKTKKNTKRLV